MGQAGRRDRGWRWLCRSAGAAPGGRATALATALVAVALIAAGCGGDDESDGGDFFAAVARGVSVATELPNGEAELNISLDFVNSEDGFTDLKVNKVLDIRSEPPWRVHDATYTLTTDDGDTLTLEAQGNATAPGSGPDPFFSGADEDFVIVNGTGRFEGAAGEGKVISAVALDELGRDPSRSPVAKYIFGTLELPED